MKKKIFFRWNNIWNVSFVIFLGILIYAFIFEREFLLSNGQDGIFIRFSLLCVGLCSLFLSRVVIADEEKVYVCNFIGMTLSVIYWKNLLEKLYQVFYWKHLGNKRSYCFNI